MTECLAHGQSRHDVVGILIVSIPHSRALCYLLRGFILIWPGRWVQRGAALVNEHSTANLDAASKNSAISQAAHNGVIIALVVNCSRRVGKKQKGLKQSEL